MGRTQASDEGPLIGLPQQLSAFDFSISMGLDSEAGVFRDGLMPQLSLVYKLVAPRTR